MPATSLLMTHYEMRKHQAEGRVRPLHDEIPEIVSWYRAWWRLTTEGWLRISDSDFTRQLDRIRMRLDTAQESSMTDAISASQYGM
jgi:predicted transcriptional regulator